MKVLLFAPPFYRYDRMIAKALRSGGASIVVETYVPYGDGESLRQRFIARHLPRLGTRWFERRQARAFNARFLSAVRAHSPDLVLVVKGEILSADTLRRARDARPGVVLCAWLMDMLRGYPQVEGLIPLYDCFFTYARSDFEGLRRTHANVRYLPLAFDPDEYAPQRVGAQDVDVAFVGRIDRFRRELLGRVAAFAARRGLRCRFVGGRQCGLSLLKWIRRYDRFTLDHVVHETLDAAQLSALYSRSRVCLNVHSLPGGGARQNAIGHNMRFFEIGGSGGVQLVDRVLGTSDLCVPGRDVVEYRDADELTARIEELLADPARRADLSARARSRFLAEHTFDHRARTILSVLSGIAPASTVVRDELRPFVIPAQRAARAAATDPTRAEEPRE